MKHSKKHTKTMETYEPIPRRKRELTTTRHCFMHGYKKAYASKQHADYDARIL